MENFLGQLKPKANLVQSYSKVLEESLCDEFVQFSELLKTVCCCNRRQSRPCGVAHDTDKGQFVVVFFSKSEKSLLLFLLPDLFRGMGHDGRPWSHRSWETFQGLDSRS